MARADARRELGAGGSALDSVVDPARSSVHRSADRIGDGSLVVATPENGPWAFWPPVLRPITREKIEGIKTPSGPIRWRINFSSSENSRLMKPDYHTPKRIKLPPAILIKNFVWNKKPKTEYKIIRFS